MADSTVQNGDKHAFLHTSVGDIHVVSKIIKLNLLFAEKKMKKLCINIIVEGIWGHNNV
jgi:hypothetical protein